MLILFKKPALNSLKFQKFLFILVKSWHNFFLAFFGIVYPLYALSIGLTNFQMTLLNALFFHLAIILLELPTGLIADFFNKKLSVGLGYFFLGMGLLFFFIPSFWFFALGELLGAVGFALNSGALDSWMIEKFGPEKSKKILADSHFYSNIVSVLAGFLATFIASWLGFGWIFVISGGFLLVLSLVCFVFMQKDENEIPHKKESLEKFLDLNQQVFQILKTKKAKSILAGLAGGIFLGYIGLFMFWQAIFTEAGIDLTLLGFVSAGMFIAMAVGNKLANLFKQAKNGVNLGIFLIALGMFLMFSLISVSPYLGLFGFLLFEVGLGIYNPQLISFFNQGLPDNIRSSLNSVLSLVMKAGSTTGLLLAGLIADQIGRENYLLIASIWVFVMWLFFNFRFYFLNSIPALKDTPPSSLSRGGD